MSINYYFPPKKYENDVKFLNSRFDSFIKDSYEKFITANTWYNGTYVTAYHFENNKKHFTDESLDDLEVVRDLRSVGLEIHHANFLFMKPCSVGELHIDNGKLNPRHTTFNIPLRDAEKSKIVWIRPDQFEGAPARFNQFDQQTTGAEKRSVGSQPANREAVNNIDLWEIVDEADASRPIILKTNTWHAVDNRLNPNKRVLFQMRFIDNPLFEDVVEKIKSLEI